LFSSPPLSRKYKRKTVLFSAAGLEDAQESWIMTLGCVRFFVCYFTTEMRIYCIVLYFTYDISLKYRGLYIGKFPSENISWGKNMKRVREKGEKHKRKRNKWERKRKKGERERQKGK
jgi:hypothetical protein